MNIELDNGQWITDNSYSIAGNEDDGYTVWETDKGEDSDTLYDGDFESCITWCYNS